MPMWTWILCGYGLASIITFSTYGFDKQQAIHGNRRISEGTLHLMELLGGWPGAIAGQMVFRHKLQKLGYMVVFGGIVVLHIAVWFACIRLNR
jgi:uncharacterized membrane protein YsdA (DUF1294 family)